MAEDESIEKNKWTRARRQGAKIRAAGESLEVTGFDEDEGLRICYQKKIKTHELVVFHQNSIKI